MKIDLDLVSNLKTMALTSSHPRVWVAAALVYKNKVVSYGVNTMKTHPYQHRYGRDIECVYWHAETLAIYNADKRLGFTRFDRSTLYVARLKFEGPNKQVLISGMAKPCSGCMRCIKDYKIPRIVYTLDHDDAATDHIGSLIL